MDLFQKKSVVFIISWGTVKDFRLLPAEYSLASQALSVTCFSLRGGFWVLFWCFVGWCFLVFFWDYKCSLFTISLPFPLSLCRWWWLLPLYTLLPFLNTKLCQSLSCYWCLRSSWLLITTGVPLWSLRSHLIKEIFLILHQRAGGWGSLTENISVLHEKSVLKPCT